VTVAAVKGFQGLFEWTPGNEPMMPWRALGGRQTSDGTPEVVGRETEVPRPGVVGVAGRPSGAP
jgi:hypothetical protein